MTAVKSLRPLPKSDLVVRTAMYEQLVEPIRDMIIEGELPQGTRIPEQRLCEKFGISRTPLREAFKVLVAEGLVELHTYRGAFVAEISESEAVNVSVVLSALEQAAAQAMCVRASEAELRNMNKLHRQMLAAAGSGDIAAYHKLNVFIHSEIVRLSGNPVLIESYDRIKTRLLRSRLVANQSEGDLAKFIAEHEDMMRAMNARNGDKLAAAIKAHYDEFCVESAAAAMPAVSRRRS